MLQKLAPIWGRHLNFIIERLAVSRVLRCGERSLRHSIHRVKVKYRSQMMTIDALSYWIPPLPKMGARCSLLRVCGCSSNYLSHLWLILMCLLWFSSPGTGLNGSLDSKICCVVFFCLSCGHCCDCPAIKLAANKAKATHTKATNENSWKCIFAKS